MTGTRIYRVHSLNKHIPRIINLFGQQIKCIYTSQPEYQEQLEKRKQQREQTHNDNDSVTFMNREKLGSIHSTRPTFQNPNFEYMDESEEYGLI